MGGTLVRSIGMAPPREDPDEEPRLQYASPRPVAPHQSVSGVTLSLTSSSRSADMTGKTEHDRRRTENRRVALGRQTTFTQLRNATRGGAWPEK
jgi:hypothetical protein